MKKSLNNTKVSKVSNAESIISTNTDNLKKMDENSLQKLKTNLSIEYQNIIYENELKNNKIIFYKKYIDQCLKGRLINNKKYKISNNPKITIIIPFYQTGDLIKIIIRSIQNQNIQDIEILLINDFSKDNNKTIRIIEKIKQKDSRIVIINNKKNMGILYSRCIGVLKARGEYIMNLDHDDFLFDRDVFDTRFYFKNNYLDKESIFKE